MVLHSAQEHSVAEEWENADEIDLTRYIGALGRRWLEILLIMAAFVALTAVAVLALRALMPPVYKATATAAIVRTSTDVRFDDRFTTSSGEQALDVNSRRMALVALVTSGSIAQQVIDDLGDVLPAELRNPVDLLENVEGEMALAGGRSGQSDLINITVRTGAPELSALVANAWANTYVQQVNRVYGQVPDAMLGSIATQLGEAQQTYQAAQEQLEAHLADSPLEALIRQSNAISETLNAVQGSDLRMYHDQWLRTSSLLAAARTLGEQVSGDEEADLAGAAQALQVLQVQMVNAAAVPPPVRSEAGQELRQPQQPASVLQLQLEGAAPMTAAALREQVVATIAGLESQLKQLESSIAAAAEVLAASSLPDENAGESGASLAAPIGQLEDALRGLQRQVEIENARTLELTEQRNLAWESVQALNNKQAEMLLARAAANSEVRLSSAAVPLDKPVERIGLAVSLALAAIVGLLVGVLAAIVLEVMNVRPLRAPQTA